MLTSVDNGSGLRSELSYRPAIEDYLRDAEEGRPWETDLPFPLLVAAGTHEVDAVSGQVTATEYRYHDGHFDATTRQFHGFGSTERVEARRRRAAPTRSPCSTSSCSRSACPATAPSTSRSTASSCADRGVRARRQRRTRAGPYHVEKSQLRAAPAARRRRAPRDRAGS